MKSEPLLLLLVVVVSAGLTGRVSAQKYSGGTGESADPYLISTAHDMNEIGAHPNDWDRHFVLTADINLADYAGTSFNIIGSSDTKFTGTFDGNDHLISNFTYTDTDRSGVGLFGYLGPGGEIGNLGLVDVNVISNSGWYIGSLVGYNDGGTISNCFATGNVLGLDEVGGLVGASTGIILSCYSSGMVTATFDDVGGLVGSTSGPGSIYDSFSSATVTGPDDTGGLVGRHWGDTISGCYATGQVIGEDELGGLVGWNFTGTVINCYATGDISGRSSGGGLIGYNDGIVINCYSSGTIGPFYYEKGGFVGTDSYGSYAGNFWDVNANPGLNGVGSFYNNDPPGVIGETSENMKLGSTFINAGWDFVGETTNGTEDIWLTLTCNYPGHSWQSTVTVPDITGLNQADAESVLASARLIVGSVVTFRDDALPSGHVFEQSPVGGCEASIHSNIDVVVSYRIYESGVGSPDDPFLIATVEQFNIMRSYSGEWDKHFALIDDIDMSPYTFSTALIAPDTSISSRYFQGTKFTGVFDGKGHSISNLIVDTNGAWSDYLGLFGFVDESAQILNLFLENATITGGDGSEYVGSLAGYSKGIINNCYVDCTVFGKNDIGGLVGRSLGGQINRCSAVAGTVDGTFNVGGLVGDNTGLIDNCYAIVNVTSGTYTGGLVGRNSGTINLSYAAGEVAGTVSTAGGLLGRLNYSTSITNQCFWDIDVNPSLTGVGGIQDPTEVRSRTTFQMKRQSTFTSFGWDFVGETTNGIEDIWRLCKDGVDYPGLAREFPVGDFVCGDGVDARDFAFFVMYWLESDCHMSNDCRGVDVNFSGEVDFKDYSIFLENWLSGL
ncbi:MAG: PASTA domain-containing protein [Phycisphaerae bacterium]|nr:PASTA domain-containing protein [Phycisphaerae bacterium]NIP54787.1 PASTA domain-containing protein [Phycisphaerae bacterium]NIS50499.1 PASTA domain-containing protein [Phycisphaerae bacterium]NIU11104.1 PASTA domain-containing protein [Phycisphaerae bacterium]NIU58990.1 PASTA domain-containing protein [Phycisphaerae bacterium]